MDFPDATAAAAAISRGELSAEDLVRTHLDRIARLDGDLRSFVATDADRALADARTFDSSNRTEQRRSLLAGVTISIKDVIDVAGLPTTHSTKSRTGHVAVADAPLVRRFRDAGLIVLGKTNVPEFCTTMTDSELNGTCRNPWDPSRTPGGSSGGAAAALAAGLCSLSHGTDGAGSVRVPASFCGLVGVKPTRGFVTFGVEVDGYYGTSVDGFLTRSVRDAAAILDIAGGRTEALRLASDVATEPGSQRVALCVAAPYGHVDDECAAAAVAAASVLEALGHTVTIAAPEWGTILQAALGPMSAPSPADLVPLADLDSVEPRNRPLLQAAHELTVTDHARWVELTRTASREFLTFFDDVDVLLSPTCGILPPSVGWAPWDQSPDEHMATFASFANFAHPFNLSGQPAVSIPTGSARNGLPIGVQLAGARGSERLLLQVAAQLELAMPWGARHPDLP